MPVVEIVKRKAKRMYPAAVEGRFFKRLGVAWKQTKTWVDRRIGYENRKILSENTLLNDTSSFMIASFIQVPFSLCNVIIAI